MYRIPLCDKVRERKSDKNETPKEQDLTNQAKNLELSTKDSSSSNNNKEHMI